MSPRERSLRVVVPRTMALASNVLLNVYGSLFISIRLTLHRRTVVAQFGPDAPMAPYLHVANILVESAILNAAVMIAAEIGFQFGLGFDHACVLISVTFQVCER